MCAGAIIAMLGAAGLTAVQLPWQAGVADAASACQGSNVITFTNTLGGSFFTPANWNDDRVPTTGDYACIPSDTGAVTFSGSTTVDGLSAAGSGGFTMTSGTLTLTDSTNASAIYDGTFTGGTITGAGNLSLEGAATWIGNFGTPITGTGTVNVVSGATLTIPTVNNPVSLGRPMTNDGTITVNNSTLEFAYDSSGALTNETDGVINLEGAKPVISEAAGYSGTFTNSGTLNSSSTGTATIGVSTTTSMAKVNLTSGSLALAGGGALSGSGKVPAGTTLMLTAGSFTATGMSLSGAGTTEITGGTTTLDTPGTTTLATAVTQITGGTITGAGNLSLGGATTWIGNTGTPITGTGTVNVVSGATLTIPTVNNPVDLGRPMTNDGTITVNNSGLWLVPSNGSLTNETDGVINLVGANPVITYPAGHPGSFTNAGTLNSSSTGTATIVDSFANQTLGRVLVTGGELLLSNSTHTNSGTITIGNGSSSSSLVVSGQYQQAAGSTTVSASSTLTSTGSNVAIAGGTLSGAGTVTSPVATSLTGTVQNGSTAGALTLADGYSGSGSIAESIDSATSYDRIAVTGTATLTGSTLAISTNAGYTPSNGQSFTVLTCSTACTGPFALVTGTALPSGATYVVNYTGTTVTLTVSGGGTGLTITTPSLPSATIGQKYSATLAATGGNPPYTWKLVKAKGSLPKGLKLNKKTGVISGTPSTKAVSSTFTVEVLDTKTKTKPKTQNTATNAFTITVS